MVLMENGLEFPLQINPAEIRSFFRETKEYTVMTTDLGRAPTNTDIKPQAMVKNAKKQVWDVKIITPQETEKRMDKRSKERANRPDYEMGTGTKWGNRANRRAARESRKASRRVR